MWAKLRVIQKKLWLFYRYHLDMGEHSGGVKHIPMTIGARTTVLRGKVTTLEAYTRPTVVCCCWSLHPTIVSMPPTALNPDMPALRAGTTGENPRESLRPSRMVSTPMFHRSKQGGMQPAATTLNNFRSWTFAHMLESCHNLFVNFSAKNTQWAVLAA